MKLNQRPHRRPQCSVGIEASQRPVRQLGADTLVAEKVNLAIETDATGGWFTRVMEEGRPAHRRSGWRLAHDPDGVVPEILFAAEPWR
jgi:hypothetical protein